MSNQVELNAGERRQKLKKLNGARYVYPCLGEQEIQQRHAAKFLDPVQTATGETLPAGTVVSVLSSGKYGHRMAVGAKNWSDNRQVHIYCD